MEKMIVLHVGVPLRAGGFGHARWRDFVCWVAESTNAMIVYAPSESVSIEAKLVELGLEWGSEPFPDPDASLKGFRILARREEMARLSGELRYDAESGVTHVYWISDERGVACVEVEEGENFIVLGVGGSEIDELCGRVSDLEGNVEICVEWRDYLDRNLGEGQWLPLGGRTEL